MKEKSTDVGVIVGRFQVHELHPAHKDLFQSVLDKHDRVIVFLGNSVCRNSLANPLDFRARQKMITDLYPNVEVFYINDHPSDDAWSKKLDKQISENLLPKQSVTLYGSRDSFLRCYSGKYQTCELESTTFISGTEVRRKVSNNYTPTTDYRAGLIAATAYRYPVCYQTVDIAVIRRKSIEPPKTGEDSSRGNNTPFIHEWIELAPGEILMQNLSLEKSDKYTDKMNLFEVLLARKPNEEKWRFIGGFSDVKSLSLEQDAVREVMEESNVEINDPVYLGSCIVDDWRYRSEVDKIKTAFFYARYVSGKPEGADDVAEVRWFKLADLKKEHVELVHHKLIDLLFCEKSINKIFSDFAS